MVSGQPKVRVYTFHGFYTLRFWWKNLYFTFIVEILDYTFLAVKNYVFGGKIYVFGGKWYFTFLAEILNCTFLAEKIYVFGRKMYVFGEKTRFDDFTFIGEIPDFTFLAEKNYVFGGICDNFEEWGVDELIVEDSWKRQVGGD
ncbi:hypothetical protein AALP_AA6G340100 [Arabis alpina]|uniref:Uncharacterized protein n=1 Tax=Arabis alpina TaxID=50452 RepID=A0A087GTH4_ARAAL|nr:hypothetical protein AALP_AA6G340100 [Arabis alpina]